MSVENKHWDDLKAIYDLKGIATLIVISSLLDNLIDFSIQRGGIT